MCEQVRVSKKTHAHTNTFVNHKLRASALIWFCEDFWWLIRMVFRCAGSWRQSRHRRRNQKGIHSYHRVRCVTYHDTDTERTVILIRTYHDSTSHAVFMLGLLSCRIVEDYRASQVTWIQTKSWISVIHESFDFRRGVQAWICGAFLWACFCNLSCVA